MSSIVFRKVVYRLVHLKNVSTYLSEWGYLAQVKIRFRNLLSAPILGGKNLISWVGKFQKIIYIFFPDLGNRTLKPFIRRDYESRPMKLKLLEEIRSKCSSTEIRNSVVKPIDYSYVQPQHIPAINAICKEFFWSGIDGKYYFLFTVIRWFGKK
jgi:hypothetical protein